MKEPKWIYSWKWTEADERRLSSAADDFDSLANELSTLAESCCSQGIRSLSSDLITDAGAHYEDELNRWKQEIVSGVASNLRASASAIRHTVIERKTLWDCFQSELKKFHEWVKEQEELRKFNDRMKEQAENLAM